MKLSPRCLPDVVSQLPPRFLRLLSSWLPLLSQMWSQNCLPIVFHSFHLSPRIRFPIVSKCIPFVAKCGLPIVSDLPPRCGLPPVFQLYPLVLNLKPSMLMGCKAGLIVSGSPDVFLYLSASPCVSHSGFRVSLHVSPALATGCLRMPLFTGLSLLVSQSGFRRLVVSGSPDVSLHLSPFIFFQLWLVVSPFWVVLFHHDFICHFFLSSVLFSLYVFLLSQELHQHRPQIT